MKTFHYFPSIVATLIIALSFSCNSTSINKEKEEDQLLRVQIGEKFGFINLDGKIVIEPQFDDANPTFVEDMCPARIGDKYGLIDKNGNFLLILDKDIKSCSNFLNGLARVSLGENSFNIINKEGNFILNSNKFNVSVNEDEVENQTYILIKGENNYKDWYICDSQGHKIGIECDSILSGFNNGLCPVKFNGKWGYMDKKGNLVIDTIYDMAKVFTEEGIARVKKDSTEYFIDKSGKILHSFEKTLSGYGLNRAAILDKHKKYLIDKKGDMVAEINADIIYSFSSDDSLATIIKDNYASKIDTSGKIVLSTKYDNIGSFINGLAIAIQNDKYGYIDKNGKEVIKVIYDGVINSFHEPKSKVRAVGSFKDNIWVISYFDLDGNLIGKDMPNNKTQIPVNPTKEDFIKYFDSRLSELDPIEGIYFVTVEDYYQNRTNPDILGLNNSKSNFFAIVKDENSGDFNVYFADGSNHWWVNKFVKIGGTNNYAIISNDLVVSKNENKYSSEGKIYT